MRPADQSPAYLSSDSSGGQHLPVAVLRQYVAGTLSAAEQHRVETHTLACVRCADVLEGFSQTDLATTDQALSNLQTRLRTRVAQEAPDATPVVPMWPSRQLVAAVFLLLVSTAVWLGVRRATEGPAAAPQVAMRQVERNAKQEVRPSLETASAPPEPTAQAEVTGEAIASAPMLEEREAVRVSPKLPRAILLPRQRAAKVAEAPALTLADADVAGAAVATSIAEENNLASNNAADTVQLTLSKQAPTNEDKRAVHAEAAPAAKAKRARTQAAPAVSNSLTGQIMSATPVPAGMRLVRGRVTDRASGAALPGVTVLVKGTTLGTSTAADGSFSLLVPETVKSLVFHFAGFTSSEQSFVSADSMLALALTPDGKMLSEAVVVRREPPPAPVSIGALPTGGYKAFQEYLKHELEYPEKALKEGKEGNVKLSFVVAEDGSLQNIKVLRGISEECDAEAVRLIQEGPKWYPAIRKGRRTARTVEISVPFRLEGQR